MDVLLEEKQQRLLQALRQEEELTAARLRKSAEALGQQRHALEMLLLWLEDRSQRGPLQMLQVWLLLTWLSRRARARVQVWPTNREGSVSVTSGCVTNATA